MTRRKKILTTLGIFILAGLIFIGIISHGLAAGGYRLLQWTALRHHTTLSKLLLACGAPPSPYKDIYDWDYFAELTDTPLHSAAVTGNVELARSLIRHGASLDWCCCSCVTPLHKAIINKQPEIVDLLLKSGADTKIWYDLRLSVLELARTQGTPAIAEMIISHDNAARRPGMNGKTFFIPKEKLRSLVSAPGSGMASDRIMVEGKKIGYLYREEPDRPGDSGWRFFSGDEDEAYTNEPDHFGIFAVNTVANYDPDIIPYLATPAPCAFEKIDGTSRYRRVSD